MAGFDSLCLLQVKKTWKLFLFIFVFELEVDIKSWSSLSVVSKFISMLRF